MKRTLLLTVSFLLCISLLSCRSNTLPLTSDNFQKDFVSSFFDTYHMVDPQLAYVSASQWEIEIKTNGAHSRDSLYLALIDNVDKAQFVSGIERNGAYMGAASYYIYVYQNADAPSPMKDWTIKSIRILEITPFANAYEDVLVRSKKYMDTIISSSVVLQTYDRDNNPQFVDMIRSAYAEPVTQELLTSVIRGTNDEQPDLLRYYLLLIDFNESKDIIWYSYLLEDEDNIYFECTSYAVDNVERRGHSMAKINDEYAKKIWELIKILS